MARGHSRGLSEAQGLTVKTIDEMPRRADVAGFFRGTPDGSLSELYEAGEVIRLYDKGVGIPVRISEVKGRSIFAQDDAGKVVRLVLEKDAGGKVVGLKESGRNGRRVV
jgi:hypothetical protein